MFQSRKYGLIREKKRKQTKNVIGVVYFVQPGSLERVKKKEKKRERERNGNHQIRKEKRDTDVNNEFDEDKMLRINFYLQ